MSEKLACRLYTYNRVTSFFDLDFDLNKVHDWYVRWATLYVKHNEGEDYQEIEVSFDGHEEDVDAFKDPSDFEIQLLPQ